MCTPEGCVSLLSLIPHLIMQPFPVREGLWVWLGGTLLLLKFQALLVDATSVVEAGGELAHCWVLRRHLRVSFLVPPLVLFSNAPWCGCGVGVVGWGVVVC